MPQMPNTAETLSARVRSALQSAGMTQAELARRVGVKQPSVNDWLSGKTQRLKHETAVKVAAALGVRLEWLVWGRGQPYEHVGGLANQNGLESASPHSPSPSQITPPLPAALPTVLDAIRACPHKEELRVLLPLLVDTDAPAYRARLLELLAGLDPRGPNLTTEDKALAARVTQAAQMAESFDVAGVMKNPVKTK
jgi:transcriptional regulator with XRE-family HTH domain